MKWICTVCGYVHEGDEPPRFCPVCQAPADDFVEDTPNNRKKLAHLLVEAYSPDSNSK